MRTGTRQQLRALRARVLYLWAKSHDDDESPRLTPHQLKGWLSLPQWDQALIEEVVADVNTLMPCKLTSEGLVFRPETTAELNAVWEHWVETLGRGSRHKLRHKLTRDRRGKIRARLREGYSVDDLKRAIDGLSLSSYHNGFNQERRKYLGIEYALRSGGRVEQMIQLAVSGDRDDDFDAIANEYDHELERVKGSYDPLRGEYNGD